MTKGCSNKCILMTFCYTHRSVPCSAIVTEAPSVVKGNKYRDAQTHNIQTVRYLGTLSLERNISTKFIPSGLRELYRRGEGKGVRVQGHGEHQGIHAVYTNKVDTHMNSWRLWQYAHGLQGFATHRVQELKEADTHPSPESNFN